jgi:hypothetical protein
MIFTEESMADFHDFVIEIAGIKVQMLCEYPYSNGLCRDFVVDCTDHDILASASNSEIDFESTQYSDNVFSRGYCEGVCLYRSIAEQMPHLDGFVFHGAAVEIGGKGVIFTAPSGTGKTTHISLLMKNYPDDVRIINGDKPIIRKVDGEWRLFSTPWAGKEGWKRNTSAPLDAIVIVNRANDNSIEELVPASCFEEIMSQVYLPSNGSARLCTFDLLDQMSKNVKFYRLCCNMNDEAATTSYNKLK